jgi:large subunit ribosomal protein L30e
MVKKQANDGINTKLALVFKSGKAVLGFKSTLKAIRQGTAQLILLANNCPTIRKA